MFSALILKWTTIKPKDKIIWTLSENYQFLSELRVGKILQFKNADR